MSALSDEIRERDRSPQALRRFAVAVGSVALGLGLLLLWRHRPSGPWFAGVGAVLLLLRAIAPNSLRPIHWVWMSFALVLGQVMTTCFLTLLFYLVFTPVGWIARRCGKDFLQQDPSSATTTGWIPRTNPPRTPGRGYERQG